MERHLSTGTATIVALLSAHSAASQRRDRQAGCIQPPVAEIEVLLRQTERPADPRETHGSDATNSHLHECTPSI